VTDETPETRAGDPLSALSTWAGQAVQIATGVAGLSYAFGWVLVTRFYGEFGIDPESAGITFGWLAIRAFLIGLVGLGFFLLARGILRIAGRIPVARPTLFEGGRLVALIVLGCLVVAVVVVLIQLAFGGDVEIADWLPTVAVAASIAAAVIFLLRPKSLEALPRLDQLLKGFAGFLIGFTAMALLLMPYRLGAHLAEDVRDGKPVDLPIVPGVPALQAPKVRVGLVDAGQTTPDMRPFLSCVLRLGGANGTSLYYANGTVLRIADENVNVTSPC
jgi:hypothetical protein